MANILSDAKKQQVIALGKLGWTLRRIEQATGVRRETAGAYLKAAGIAVRPPGDRKSTRLNSSHLVISYAVFCLKKKKKHTHWQHHSTSRYQNDCASSH